MKTNTKSIIIVVCSALFALAVVNTIFWVLSVNEPGLISTFSAMIAAALSNSMTRRYESK